MTDGRKKRDPKPAGDASEDVALLCGRTEDGNGVAVLRKRRDRIEVGALRPLEEGKPLGGEVVRLKPRPGTPQLCDVEVQFENPLATAASASGPAQVASDAYRRNWDAVWKRPSKRVLN